MHGTAVQWKSSLSGLWQESRYTLVVCNEENVCQISDRPGVESTEWGIGDEIFHFSRQKDVASEPSKEESRAVEEEPEEMAVEPEEGAVEQGEAQHGGGEQAVLEQTLALVDAL